MGKKKKKNKSKKRTSNPKQAAAQPQKRSKYALLAMLAGGVLVLGGAYFLFQGQKPPIRSPQPQLAEVKKVNVNLRETRSTMSPQLFSGKVRRAYEIARAIPDVLDQLYCYCRCRENFGHKNLLSCFVDTHAST